MKKILGFIEKHFIVMLAGAFMIVLALVFMIIGINMNYSASLDILVVPTDAKILVDGREYANGLYENLHIGKALVQISREGFESQKFEIELRRGEKTKLYVLLDGDEEFSNDNADETTLYLTDIINEYLGELETAELVEKYPIMADLPIAYEDYLDNYTKYVSYRVDGGQYKECTQVFCLKITDITGGNYERALEAIRGRGYNPDDYEIIYEDTSKKGHA